MHNVLYRYLFRTIFLFRPRAPAAPCSRSFLLSYCSTPPLKRKIKFSLQTVPFVPTPAGLLSGAHFLPERGGGGWNPRHSFLQAVLLSAAQFAGQALLYRLLSCTQFRGAGVGIPRTVYGGRGCYRQHNFGAVCIAGQKKWLLSGAQFGLFFCGRQVVIHSTICAMGKIRLLLSAAHFGISSAFQTCPSQVVIQRTFPAVGLLSGAQFPNCRILAAVVIDGTFLKKSTVQRAAGIVIHGTIRFFRGRVVVIRRTIRKNPVFFGASCRGLLVCAQFALQGRGCYRRHNTRIFQHGLLFSAHFPAAGFFHPPCWSAAHISHFSFFRARGLLYSTLFKNPTKFSLPPFSCKKTFLPLLRSAHCCVFHICVGRLRTAPL